MTWEGASAAKAALDAIRARVYAAAPGVVRDGSLLLQAQQRENATHRPGPMVRTGALWRGILTNDIVQTGSSSWTGGTKATVIYSRIQERGGTIYPKPGDILVHRVSSKGKAYVQRLPRMLVWTDGPRPVGGAAWRAAQKAGLVHRARHVTLPARPYFAPGIIQTAPKYEALAAARFGAAIIG